MAPLWIGFDSSAAACVGGMREAPLVQRDYRAFAEYFAVAWVVGIHCGALFYHFVARKSSYCLEYFVSVALKLVVLGLHRRHYFSHVLTPSFLVVSYTLHPYSLLPVSSELSFAEPYLSLIHAL